MAKQIVIIGGGAAGIDVLEFLLRGKEYAEDMNITLLKKEKEGFFSMCGLPYALQGMCSLKALKIFEPEFYRGKGIDFRTSAEVISINLEKKYVHLDSGEKVPYDYLVIATGSKPSIPPIGGTNLDGVYTLGSSSDGELLERAITAKKLKDILIIGCGWIGLQTAVAFCKNNIRTRIVERLPHLLPALLDADMASIIQRHMENDIIFLFGMGADRINGKRRVESVTLGGKEYPADAVLISTGMSPNVDMPRKAGMKIGGRGGIVTDLSLRVKKGKSYLDSVYALGDCIEVIDAITYRPRLSQLASTALIQARVVANNILGRRSSYDSCLSPSVANISGLQIGSVGITSEEAGRYGIPIKAGRSNKLTKARFFPDRKMISAKLIFHASSEKLIGAQIISEYAVAERINELTLGIRNGITARDIWMRERCFDPSLTVVEDVLVDAAINSVRN